MSWRPTMRCKTGASILHAMDGLLDFEAAHAREVLLARLVGRELPDFRQPGLFDQPEDGFYLRIERHVMHP